MCNRFPVIYFCLKHNSSGDEDSYNTASKQEGKPRMSEKTVEGSVNEGEKTRLEVFLSPTNIIP